jgi:hypothetical protein
MSISAFDPCETSTNETADRRRFGVIETRLTGPTVVPRMRCHWANRYYAY